MFALLPRSIRKRLKQPSPAASTDSAELPAEDKALVAKAFARVTPLSTNTYQHPPKRPKPQPRRPDPAATPLATNTTITWLAQSDEGGYQIGQRHDILKRMRRKEWHVQSELDLHGMTGDEAEVAAERFLIQCQQRGLQRVRIIHGKGLRSPNQEPILKKRIYQWLIRQSAVLAFTHPPATQGGNGAVLVLLKSAAPIQRADGNK